MNQKDNLTDVVEVLPASSSSDTPIAPQASKPNDQVVVDSGGNPVTLGNKLGDNRRF